MSSEGNHDTRTKMLKATMAVVRSCSGSTIRKGEGSFVQRCSVCAAREALNDRLK